MTDEYVREVVADMLVETGHGNPQFISSVRAGGQDDGPYMRAALAVRDGLLKMAFPQQQEEPSDE